MNIKKLGKSLLGFAPTVATMLGGPMAGQAVAALANQFTGGDEDALAGFIAGASPETMAKIKQWDHEYRLELTKAGVEFERMAVDNTKSARAMATAKGLLPQLLLSVIVLTAFGIVLYLVFSGKTSIQEGVRDMALLLLGVLTGEVPRVMQFWLGSSTGSKRKVSPPEDYDNG